MTVIVVTKRTAWEQHNQNPELYGAANHKSLGKMRAAHKRHHATLSEVMQELRSLKIRPWLVEGADVAFKVQPDDVVVCVGGDGTVLSASHRAGKDAYLMGINSDSTLSYGRLCNAIWADVRWIVEKRRKVTKVPRMTVEIDGRVVASRVLNEVLFSHSCPASMTRVVFERKTYMCSGLWVGTGAGSTGAIKSAGGRYMPVLSKELQTVVREPFNVDTTRCISRQAKKFDLVSKTTDGTLYVDGSFLRIPVGFDQKVRFYQSAEPLQMLGPPLT